MILSCATASKTYAYVLDIHGSRAEFAAWPGEGEGGQERGAEIHQNSNSVCAHAVPQRGIAACTRNEQNPVQQKNNPSNDCHGWSNHRRSCVVSTKWLAFAGCRSSLPPSAMHSRSRRCFVNRAASAEEKFGFAHIARSCSFACSTAVGCVKVVWSGADRCFFHAFWSPCLFS